MLDKFFLLNDCFNELEGIKVPCPSCRKGNMAGRKGMIAEEETKDSIESRNHPEWDAEWLRWNFGGILNCDTCTESISILGTMHLDHGYKWDAINQVHEEFQASKYYPKFFNPCLQIIEIPKKCPENIRDVLEQSFSLYWADLDSCANKLRITLEKLMDGRKIKKTFITKKGDRRTLSLDNRINTHFSKKHPELAKLLLAVKWIGNEGSHVGGLIREDLVNAYELIEHTLNEIYDSKIARLQKISQTINKTKKPISKTRKKR